MRRLIAVLFIVLSVAAVAPLEAVAQSRRDPCAIVRETDLETHAKGDLLPKDKLQSLAASVNANAEWTNAPAPVKSAAGDLVRAAFRARNPEYESPFANSGPLLREFGEAERIKAQMREPWRAVQRACGMTPNAEGSVSRPTPPPISREAATKAAERATSARCTSKQYGSSWISVCE